MANTILHINRSTRAANAIYGCSSFTFGLHTSRVCPMGLSPSLTLWVIASIHEGPNFRRGMTSGPGGWKPRRVGGRMSGCRSSGIPVADMGAQTIDPWCVHQGAGFDVRDPCNGRGLLTRIIGGDGHRLMARHTGIFLWPTSHGAVHTIAALAPAGLGQMGVHCGQTVFKALAETIDDSLFPGGARRTVAVHPAFRDQGPCRVFTLDLRGLNLHLILGGRGQDVEIRSPARLATVATVAAPRSLMTRPPPGCSERSASRPACSPWRHCRRRRRSGT